MTVLTCSGHLDVTSTSASSCLAHFRGGEPLPPVPLWGLPFKDVRVFLLGGDFPVEAKAAAARELSAAPEAAWRGL
jgi:hypothetical protein